MKAIKKLIKQARGQGASYQDVGAYSSKIKAALNKNQMQANADTNTPNKK